MIAPKGPGHTVRSTYQEGKGVAAAVEKACQYINEGYTIVAEMDIESYFDKIPLDRMMLLIEQKIEDKAVRQLIRRFLYCKVAFDSRIEDKTIGIIQVNPASPVLSNFLFKINQFVWKYNVGRT